MAVNLGAGGQVQASLGLQLAASPNQVTPNKPAFWSFVILGLLLVAIAVIARSLR